MTTIKLYSMEISGHGHRVELLLRFLNLPYEFVRIPPGPIRKTPEFLTKNPLGQIPVLEDGEVTIWDSAAILVYLSRTYDKENRYFPIDPKAQAEVVAWLAKAAGPLYYGPTTARRINLFKLDLDPTAALAESQKLLAFMDAYLTTRAFLVDDQVTIADIAHYTYIRHAPEGGIDLGPYPSVIKWCERIEALDNFIAMPKSALGLNRV
jgi:glutathione S-transferase